ncbi:MAG TPA: hypothetical protein VNS81_01210 [Nocardioides sp.]|nr:hypothetical protein [Nocardioides sp.]
MPLGAFGFDASLQEDALFGRILAAYGGDFVADLFARVRRWTASSRSGTTSPVLSSASRRWRDHVRATIVGSTRPPRVSSRVQHSTWLAGEGDSCLHAVRGVVGATKAAMSRILDAGVPSGRRRTVLPSAKDARPRLRERAP